MHQRYLREMSIKDIMMQKVTSTATIVQRTTWAIIIPTEFSGNKLATDGMPVHFLATLATLNITHQQMAARLDLVR